MQNSTFPETHISYENFKIKSLPRKMLTTRLAIITREAQVELTHKIVIILIFSLILSLNKVANNSQLKK